MNDTAQASFETGWSLVSALQTSADVAGLNDELALRHDIDEYYTRSSAMIRLVEGMRLRWIRQAANLQPGERVLEVGCGGGHVLRMFPHGNLTGVDVSPRMLEKAARNLAGLRPILLQGEIHQLRLPVNAFDVVICTEVLEHVLDPADVLANIHRLMKPGGRTVITFPNDRLIHLAKAIIQKSRLQSLPGFGRISWGGDDYHLHQWSLTEMRKLLSEHFHIRQYRGIPSRLCPIRRCFLCTPLANPALS